MEPHTILNRLFLFRNLDFDQIDSNYRISQRCLTRRYESDEIILSAECRTEGLCLILHGRVRMESAHGGHEIVLRYASEGETFGAASLFTESAHQTRVIAESASEILILPESLVLEILANIPECAKNYLSFLSERITFLNRKIAAFTAGSAEARLALYLAGQKSSEDGTFVCPIAMSSLASQLGIGRASLYRAIDNLTDAGLIRYDGGHFTVPDRDALARLVK